jgi:hypothetical protein
MWHIAGLLARSGGFGAMGHLGHIAIVEKSLAYNIVYSHSIQYCIHFYFYLLIPNMTQMTQTLGFSLGARIGQTRQNTGLTFSTNDPCFVTESFT